MLEEKIGSLHEMVTVEFGGEEEVKKKVRAVKLKKAMQIAVI